MKNWTDVITEARVELENRKDRSAWDKGVTVYAYELLREVADTISGGWEKPEILTNWTDMYKAMLCGAPNWHEYSWGGSSLIYDQEIAERLCAPWELKRTRNGERRPNSREDWLDVQTRALQQAAVRVWRAVMRHLHSDL